MSFLFKKIELWLLILIIFVGLISLILFGSILLHEVKGGDRFPKIQKTALFFAEIPSTLFRIIKTYEDPMHQVKVIRANDFKGKSGLNLYKKVERDYILLLSRFDGDLNTSVVEAYDLKNFEIIHKWKLNLPEILKKIDFKENLEFKDLKHRNQTNFAMRAPFVDSQGNLLFSSNSPLIKVDFCGNLVWVNQEDNFHHSIEEDHENFIRLQEKDRFILNYMNWLGHLEFGKNYKIKFKPTLYDDPNTFNHWIEQWYMTYEKVKETFLKLDNIKLVCYEQIDFNSNKFKNLLNILSLEHKGIDFNFLIKNREINKNYDVSLLNKCNNLYSILKNHKNCVI